MTTAPRLKAPASPGVPRIPRLSHGASRTTRNAVAAPTTIEVTQESPTTVPARCGSEFLCSATNRVAVMLNPEVSSGKEIGGG